MDYFRLSLIKIGPASIGIHLPTKIMKNYSNLDIIYILLKENCEIKIFLKKPHFRTREIKILHKTNQVGILIPKQILDDVNFFFPNSHTNPKDKVILSYNDIESSFIVKFEM